MNYYLGIDNGGTVIKAALYDAAGSQVSVASEKVEMICPKVGFTERELSAVWAANASAVRKCLARSGVRADDIRSVGLSGHGKGLYITDKAGNPVYRGIVSTDSRASEIEKAFYAEGVAARAYKKTFQKVLACQPVCLLRWLKENDRAVYDKIGWIMSAKDYIRYCLTGKIRAELTDISGTNLLNLQTMRYDAELPEMFGIPEIAGALPPLCKSAEICGYVTAAAAEQTGLREGTPVSGGMFDIDACAVGVGICDERDVCVIGGTWSINEYISPAPVLDGSISMNSAFCKDGYYLIEECSPTSAGNLEWVIERFFSKERAECGSSDAFYAMLNEGVAKIEPQECGVVFLPFLFDCNEGADLGAAFLNLKAFDDKMMLARAVYEGVVFSHKTHIDRLLKSRNTPAKIRLAGGVTKSAVWSQMFADVTGLNVEAVADKELGCFGAAMVAAVAVGDFASIDEAEKACVGKGKMYYPNPENSKIYAEKYARYKGIIEKLK